MIVMMMMMMMMIALYTDDVDDRIIYGIAAKMDGTFL